MVEEVFDFAEIHNEIYREEMDRIPVFNLMLVGLTGVGKSTLVRSLFRGKITPNETTGEPGLNIYEDIMEENYVKRKIRCIETSGFRSHDISAYTDYIREQCWKYFLLQETDEFDYPEEKDPRIHCCIYMIPPHGKLRLDSEDINCMKALHDKVNLVPVIAKADSLNSTRRAKFKENVLADLKANGIDYFKFHVDPKEDEELSKAVKMQVERFPFAVVAAEEPIMENNKLRWICESGSCKIDIDNDKDYDFDALAKLLIRYCDTDLVDTTHTKHYRQYHSILLEILNEMSKSISDSEDD